MKLITAVIKPFKLDEVKAALGAFGVVDESGQPVTDVGTHGRIAATILSALAGSYPAEVVASRPCRYRIAWYACSRRSPTG